MHAALRQPDLVRQAVARPVRLTAQLAAEGRVDQRGDLILAGTARSAGLELVVQSGDALFGVTLSPQRHGWATHPLAARHRGVGLTVRQSQDQLRTTRQRGRQTLRSGDRLLLHPVLRRDCQLDCRSSHRCALPVPSILLGPHTS